MASWCGCPKNRCDPWAYSAGVGHQAFLRQGGEVPAFDVVYRCDRQTAAAGSAWTHGTDVKPPVRAQRPVQPDRMIEAGDIDSAFPEFAQVQPQAAEVQPPVGQVSKGR